MRHGRTAANVADVFRGVRISLSMRGAFEAALLYPSPGGAAEFTLFLSSDLQRAWETALIISRNQSVPAGTATARAFLGLRRGSGAARLLQLSPASSAVSGRLKALRCGGEGCAGYWPGRGAAAEAPPPPWKPAPVSSGEPRRFDQRLYLWCSGAVGRQMALCPAPASLSILSHDPLRQRSRLLLFDDTSHLNIKS